LRVRIRIHTRSPKEHSPIELRLQLGLALAGLVAAVVLAETGHEDLARIVLGLDALRGAARWRINIHWRR
jgi:hypothetical protein